MPPRTADELRRAFTGFYAARDHTVVPSASLIPVDPTVLFTVAGMVPFKPYFVGDEAPPYSRATSVQKCFRTVDIDIVGTTTRHCTFFEMLGNFSFGDYFKPEAIAWAWELVTEVLGLDPERLWATVHESDDEAERIWIEAVGIPPERVQRMGEDNFWEMAKGAPGPCGPSSEIYYDKGPEHGAEGGPLHGGAERYVEIWNLVFMQFNRQPSGDLVELPRKNIDTGAGLERILPILQGTTTIFDTDVLRPLVEAAESLSGRRYGADPVTDVSLRVLAEHGRAMTFLVADGVYPSNEDRGYVLRRILRRAVSHAHRLGVSGAVTPTLVETTVSSMGGAYPELVKSRDLVVDIVTREEQQFRRTLASGSAILDDEMARLGDAAVLPGDVAFRLHDTFGFPLELTREIAADRGVEVDVDGFAREMAEQRRRAKAARATGTAGDAGDADRYRELLDEFGTTEFTGYTEVESKARVLAVLDAPEGRADVFLDRTPFYAEGGGQVGDTGTVTTETGVARVLDTTYALPGLHRHLVEVVEGTIEPGQDATAAVDADRRDAIRRNHTATHLLHWALREVLGGHVKQQGSLVAPDRLRFDFSHHAPASPAELRRIEDLVHERVLANEPVRAYETSKAHAEELGAIAFFGDKYGDYVRVLEAGSRSVELCGGTHVGALGMIGPVKIVSEGSIGSNLRRIEAITGSGALARIREEEDTLARAAELLRARPDELTERLERLLEQERALHAEVKALRRQLAGGEASGLAATAVDGVVVGRRDGLSREELRDLAVAVRDQPGVRAAVLGGVPEGGGVSLVAAVAKDSGLVASDLIADAARTVGGGGGKQPDLAVAGGKDAARLDEALDQARLAAGVAPAPA